MEAMNALDTHEDEIRLCAAKLYWSDVAEAEAVVKELQAKNDKLHRELHQAEKALEVAMSRKDTLGDSASLSNVSCLPFNNFTPIGTGRNPSRKGIVTT